MNKKPTGNIIIALCTSGALIAFAFDQRGHPVVRVSAVTLFVAAAIICLLPVLYGSLRHKTCKK
jgi:hypothetical protein